MFTCAKTRMIRQSVEEQRFASIGRFHSTTLHPKIRPLGRLSARPAFGALQKIEEEGLGGILPRKSGDAALNRNEIGDRERSW
jgi:hypothetical protein